MTGDTLRAAGTSDAPAITEVFLAARKAMTYLPVVHTDDQTTRFIAGVVESDQVQVAERDGVIIGFAAVAGSWLAHLNVQPSCQSQGVGSRLITWAKQISPTGLDLWVFQRNTRARALYAFHGWHDVVLTDGADNEEGQPDAHMWWEPSHDR